MMLITSDRGGSVEERWNVWQRAAPAGCSPRLHSHRGSQRLPTDALSRHLRVRIKNAKRACSYLQALDMATFTQRFLVGDASFELATPAV
jgi:hypothetical protein